MIITTNLFPPLSSLARRTSHESTASSRWCPLGGRSREPAAVELKFKCSSSSSWAATPQPPATVWPRRLGGQVAARVRTSERVRPSGRACGLLSRAASNSLICSQSWASDLPAPELRATRAKGEPRDLLLSDTLRRVWPTLSN